MVPSVTPATNQSDGGAVQRSAIPLAANEIDGPHGSAKSIIHGTVSLGMTAAPTLSPAKSRSRVRRPAGVHVDRWPNCRTTLDAVPPLRLAEFARACKAASRAVSLYPGGHPAIGTTLGRLARADRRADRGGPFTLEVRPNAIARQQRRAGQARCRDRRARRRPAPAADRRADAERRRQRRLVAHAADAALPAGRGGARRRRHRAASGRRPAARASRSSRSTTPRCCARSRETQPPPSGSIAAALWAARLELDESGMRLLLDIVRGPGPPRRS